MSNVTIFPNFITPEECEELNIWAKNAVINEWLCPGIDRTKAEAVFYDNRTDIKDISGAKNRFSSTFYPNKFDRYPDLAYKIKDRIVSFLNLHGLLDSRNNGGQGKDSIIALVIQPGGDMFPHRDIPEPENRHLFRCNIMTQAAEEGGELFVENRNGDYEKIDVKVGDLHCYMVTKYEHYSSTVKGNKDRILWLTGYQIAESDPRYARWI